MRFSYTYRSSDGERHAAEIEAESRDAAFAKIRAELGVKPIKVAAAGEGSGKSAASPNSASPRGSGALAASSKKRNLLIAAAVLCAAVLGGATWWMRRPNRESQTANGELPTATQDQPVTVATLQGPVTLRMAEPLPRQAIPGDRRRIDAGRDTIFSNAAERHLARFAEPGRAVAAPEGAKPTEADFAACLREPIRIASTDFTEVVDLKRIVTGMKREMRAYIAGGGTVEGYLAELEKRQKLEVSYRERAEQKLNELLSAVNGQAARSPSTTGGTPVVPDAAKMAAPHTDGTTVPGNGQDVRSPGGRDSLKAAYAYWLKANAQLQAMGIYPLVLPDVLRSYQMSLDIEE